MNSIAVASLALVLAGPAAAQPAASAPGTAAAPLAASPAPVEEPPYQGTALLLSLGGSVASWTTMLIGAQFDHGNNPAVPLGAVATLLAPSFGQWYAGTPFSRGLRTRLIGAGVMVAAAIPAISCEDECNPGGPLAWAFYAGLGLYLYGTLDDIITAPDAARAAQPHRIGLAPMIQRRGGGLSLAGQF